MYSYFSNKISLTNSPLSSFVRRLSKLKNQNNSPLEYCTKIVSSSRSSYNLDEALPLESGRQHDYENFLATLLLHAAIRSSALVIRAFNVEVARIQDQTTDIKTAEFRLQFWYDTLDKIYARPQELRRIPANPIAQELYKISCTEKLPKRHLQRLVKSRHGYLRKKYFNTLEEIENYAEDSVSPIYYSLLSIAGIENVHADHVASHLGKAQGLANILRSTEVWAQYKTVSLPLDILTKHGVSQETVLRCIDDKHMRDVVFEVASRANSHLEKARSLTIPKNCASLFLPASSVSIYLKNLEAKDFDVFDKTIQRRSFSLPFKLYCNKISQKF